jgi:dTDP-4-dehydrorhamnose reductase
MKVLITGLSGYIGQYLYCYRPNEAEITGTYCRNEIKVASTKMVHLDLDSVEAFKKYAGRYDLIIHTAANANLADCEKNRRQAFRVNSKATEILARWSQGQASRFIYLSTDIVFGGDRGDYTEKDQPNPVNVYGNSKWQGERAVANCHNNYAICRLALTLGKARGSGKNFIDQFLKGLDDEKEISLFVDEQRTPVTPQFAAKSVWEIAFSQFTGIIHVCGLEKINRYQLGEKIAAFLNRPVKNLRKTYMNQVSSYPRPLDVSMCSLHASKVLSIPQQKISDVIEDML